MSALADVKAAAVYAATAIDTIDQAVKVIDGGGAADTVLSIVGAMLTAFATGVTTGATPAQISAELAKLGVGVSANDAAADAAVAAKFPTP